MNRSDRAPLRVLQVVLNLNPGGAERLIVEIVKRLPAGFESAVVCLDEAGAWAEEIKARDVPVEVLHRAPGFRPSLGYRIARIARKHGIGVVHCHQYTPFVYGSIARFLKPRLHLVFTEHGRLSDAPPSRKRAFANRLLCLLPGRYFAVCEDLRRHMVAEGFPDRRVEVLYNGIEIGSRPTADDRARARSDLGLAPDAFVVGTVARLDAVKDLPTLLDAFQRLRARVAGAALVVVGDGEERARLEQLASDGVHFTGHRSDVCLLLAAMDLFVNSSISEGISLTIVEAMAAGLPVVATRVGGTPEVVADRTTGTLVSPADPEALSRAMIELAEAPERRSAFGDAGRAVACERFTIERMVEAYARAYRRERST